MEHIQNISEKKYIECFKILDDHDITTVYDYEEYTLYVFENKLALLKQLYFKEFRKLLT